MKTKRLFLFLGLSIFLAACGDDNSSSAATEQDDTITSSSALPESSSEQLSSSSSANELSSSAAESSSSIDESSSSVAESSSAIDESSSSELLDLSTSTISWYGEAGEYTINTGIAEAEWYMFNDSAEGGHSTITWPVPLGNDYTDDSFDPVIDECGGFCGTFNLSQGSMDHKPYVGVGFNLAGSKALPVDATNMWGICIMYTSDVSATLELVLDKETEAAIDHDRPFVNIPKASSAEEVCTVWEKFRQAGWGNPISIDEAVKSVVSIQFKIQAADSTTGKFNIIRIFKQVCCAAP